MTCIDESSGDVSVVATGDRGDGIDITAVECGAEELSFPNSVVSLVPSVGLQEFGSITNR